MIILMGPKHSGKTSAGKELARRGVLPFVDLDALIEERCGKSPRDLYLEGPELFRRKEAEALEAVLNADAGGQSRRENGVLALGGGIIDNPAAMKLLGRYRADTVYLALSAETAWGRIFREELPPFLAGENPRERHRLLHQRRAGAYRAFAALSVEAEGKSPGVIAGEILSAGGSHEL
ncbi:MAG: shikimate kinase [Treponema sp.]|nr:shikimate kinase [Treponema sp.]